MVTLKHKVDIIQKQKPGTGHDLAHAIVHGLAHPLLGVLVTALAGAALLFWEYLRLTGSSSGGWQYLGRVRLGAFALTVIALATIACRFIAVEHPSL